MTPEESAKGRVIRESLIYVGNLQNLYAWPDDAAVAKRTEMLKPLFDFAHELACKIPLGRFERLEAGDSFERFTLLTQNDRTFIVRSERTEGES
jgi:hypothetical protein